MRIWLLGLAVFLLLAGCANDARIPSGIIPRAEMEKILWEMIQTERYTTSYLAGRADSLADMEKQNDLYFERVFQLHGISRDEFIKSYKFYLGRPDITKVMFDSIASRGERERNELYRERAMRDSIRINRSRDSVLNLRKQAEADSVETSDSSMKKRVLEKKDLLKTRDSLQEVSQ